jgi:hypothetical protein
MRGYVSSDKPGEGKRNGELPQAHLDGPLPKASDAQVARVASVFNEGPCMGAQLFASPDKPQKCMGV